MAYHLVDYLLDQAITWIRAANPRRIRVTGYAATRPASVSGHSLAERPAVARERAERVAEALFRLGVERSRIEVRWRSDSAVATVDGADGLAEPSRRRADIEVFQ
jgi:outer membrane protein OmpA-like peptidoglycan-associated protein